MERASARDGRTEVPLDETGEEQVDDLVQILESFPFKKIFSSPQLRAQQTAQKFGISRHLPVVTDDRLSELIFVDGNGKHADELLQDEVYLARKKNFLEFEHGEIESYKSLAKRVREFIGILEHVDEHVAVVSHADVIRAAIIELLHITPAAFFQFKVQNASCTILKHASDRWNWNC